VKFQIKKTSNDQYRFNIVATNGQILATSETYTRKQSAKDAIESVMKSAGGCHHRGPQQRLTLRRPRATLRTTATGAAAEHA